MRPYNPQSKKLDPKTINGYFIGYCVGSRGFRFCPSHAIKVIESNRAIYFDDDTSTCQGPREIVFKEHLVFIHMSIASSPISSSVVDQHLVATTDNEPIEDVDLVAPYVDLVAPYVVIDIPLRRLERARRPAILDDYIVYLQEYYVGDVSGLTTYKEVIVSPQSNFWIDAMKDEMTSMSLNKVRSLVDFPNDYRPIGCKWVFKTKCDAKGQVERYKTTLVAKGYNQ